MFLPSPYDCGVGAINTSDENKRDLAIKSRTFELKDCNLELQPDPLP